MYLSIYQLSIYPSIYLSVYLYIYLCIYLGLGVDQDMGLGLDLGLGGDRDLRLGLDLDRELPRRGALCCRGEEGRALQEEDQAGNGF